MNPAQAEKRPEHQLGRYAIYDQIAAGGMASVHLARLAGPEGFSRVVAVKRLHRHLFQDADFKRMFLDEARLAARIRHLNVVPILDVLVDQHELMIVMDYVHGESLLTLSRAARRAGVHVPPAVACAILFSVLEGLHAAHEARDEKGEPLGIVHRDVSPHNVLVGEDGVARVLDFGVAKARQARQDTNPGTLKGKYSYMAPEVLRGEQITRQADVFSASIVFWELLAGRKLFPGGSEQERLITILKGGYPHPREFVPDIPEALDEIVMHGLAPDPKARFSSALEMATQLEARTSMASQRVVAEWVRTYAGQALDQRADLLQQIEVSKFKTRSVSSDNLLAQDDPPSASTSQIAELSVEVSQPSAPSRGGRLWWIAGGIAAVLAVGVVWLTRKGGEAPANDVGNSAARADSSQYVAPPSSPLASVQQAPAPVAGSASSSPAPSSPASAASGVRNEPPRAFSPATPQRKGSGRGKDFLPEEL